MHGDDNSHECAGLDKDTLNFSSLLYADDYVGLSDAFVASYFNGYEDIFFGSDSAMMFTAYRSGELSPPMSPA